MSIIEYYLLRMDQEMLVCDGSAELSHEEAKQALRDVYLLSTGEKPEYHPSRVIGWEPDPQVRSILDISTAHVSESTGAMLDSWGELGPYPGAPIVYSKGEYGWLVYVPSEMSNREDKHLIPDDLWEVMVYAHAKGCDWIMFDRDGVTIPALKEFEW